MVLQYLKSGFGRTECEQVSVDHMETNFSHGILGSSKWSQGRMSFTELLQVNIIVFS